MGVPESKLQGQKMERLRNQSSKHISNTVSNLQQLRDDKLLKPTLQSKTKQSRPSSSHASKVAPKNARLGFGVQSSAAAAVQNSQMADKLQLKGEVTPLRDSASIQAKVITSVSRGHLSAKMPAEHIHSVSQPKPQQPKSLVTATKDTHP